MELHNVIMKPRWKLKLLRRKPFVYKMPWIVACFHLDRVCQDSNAFYICNNNSSNGWWKKEQKKGQRYILKVNLTKKLTAKISMQVTLSTCSCKTQFGETQGTKVLWKHSFFRPKNDKSLRVKNHCFKALCLHLFTNPC